MRRVLSVWLVCTGLLACSEPPPPASAPVVRPVKMLVFGTGESSATREYPGTVSPAQSSYMAFEVPGRVAEFPMDEGQFVEEGELLARLDPRDYQAARDSAAARRNAAQADLARYEQAFSENAVTRQDLDIARRELELTDADLRTARKALEDTELKAPFAGRVARKLVDDFANVQAKEPVLILQDETSLEMKVSVPERDWALAPPGLTPQQRTERLNPRVQIASFPGLEFAARIKEIATTADPVTRTFQGTVAFENPPDAGVSSGMTGKLIISLPGDLEIGAGATMIPASAVLGDDGGEPYVWVVDPSTMAVGRTPVRLGEMAGSEVRILGGLEPGERIAVSGVQTLREGMVVRPLDP